LLKNIVNCGKLIQDNSFYKIKKDIQMNAFEETIVLFLMN
jgi:hypothetical protein